MGKDLSTIKESQFGPKTRQNHYTSNHQLMVDQTGLPVLAPAQYKQMSSLVIGGIPFHIIQPVNSSKDSSNLTVENPPIYETIESDCYSEMSSVFSERGKMEPTKYQDFPSYNESHLGASLHSAVQFQFVDPHSGQTIQSQATQFVSMTNRPCEEQRPKIQLRPDQPDYGTQPPIASLKCFPSNYDSSLRPGPRCEQYQTHSEPSNQPTECNQTQMSQSEVILQSVPNNSPITQL